MAQGIWLLFPIHVTLTASAGIPADAEPFDTQAPKTAQAGR